MAISLDVGRTAINYDYYQNNPEEQSELAAHEAAFVRPLKRVLPRLQLLGYTLEHARAEYESLVDSTMETTDNAPPEEAELASILTFEEFCSLACRYPISSLSSEYIEFDTPEREQLAQGRLANDDDIDRVPWAGNSDLYWSEASYFSSKLCVLSAPAMLQVFGLSPANAEADVIWQFGPLVNAGWAARESFQSGARRAQSILVATEGASDARIVSRALEILRPDVADFFRFIDVEERHHFWGHRQFGKIRGRPAPHRHTK
ncbi:HEPN/Toprim-associated domain-containing protein [Bradyrhizobium sacchari]|nr:HEPN/Toprim-associated domain-containing protein [Bradyrhizobium sacchari]